MTISALAGIAAQRERLPEGKKRVGREAVGDHGVPGSQGWMSGGRRSRQLHAVADYDEEPGKNAVHHSLRPFAKGR